MENIIKKINTPLFKKTAFIIIALISLLILLDLGMSAAKNNASAREDLKIKTVDITVPPVLSYPEYAQKLKSLFSAGAKNDKDAAGKKFELISIINGGKWDKIKLNGTLINDNISLAIFSADGKNYAVSKNEALGDYTVRDITKSTVTIEGNGEKKTIMVNYSGDLSAVSETTSNGRTIKREELNALIEPPDRLAKEATFTPVQEGGGGVMLSYLKDGSLLQKIGLMQNDIMTQVNGETLKSGNDIFKAYQIFRNEDHISIKVKRGGEEIDIKLEVK